MFRKIPVFLFLITFVVAPIAAAQSAKEVDELRKKVAELEKQIESLRSTADSEQIEEMARRIEILTREIESLRIEKAAPAAADEFDAGLGQAASKIYRSGNGFSFGGYGEMVYHDYDDPGATSELDFLRAVLYTGYKFNDRVLFNSELEVEHAKVEGDEGEVALEFAYLDFRLRPEANVRAGLLLMPFGLVNEMHEPTAFLGVNRPSVERSIIPATWRENGAGLYGDVGPVSYRAYVVTGFDAEGFSASGIRGGRQEGAEAAAEDLGFVGRVDWAPVEGLLFGGSFYAGNSGQGLETPSGENIEAPVDMFELHGDARIRGWWLRALWVDGSVGDVSQLNESLGLTGSESIGESFGGWYAEVGYDLATVVSMGQMSVTPFVRYESLDTQKDVPSGFSANPANDREILTFGVSWKPIPQTVFKIDYQNIDNEAGTGVDQLNLGLGYIF